MGAVEVERHEDRVRGLAVAQIVARSVALPDETERFVELDRRLVPRKDVQFELRDCVRPRPRDRALEQRAADAAAAGSRVHHEAEIRDMPARRMLVARERQAADELAVQLGDEHSRVGMTADGADEAALLPHAPPLRRDEPALRLGADRARERDERRRVAGLGGAHVHSTTTAAPPRRGSAAAAGEPSARTSTAFAPPKKRFCSFHWTTCSASRPSVSAPASAWISPSSQCRRPASTAARTSSPRASTLTIPCRIAPRRRALPALPTTSRGRPSTSTMLGAIIDVSRRPGLCRPARSDSPSMLLSWIPVPGANTPEPAPVEQLSDAALPRPSTTEMCVVVDGASTGLISRRARPPR